MLLCNQLLYAGFLTSINTKANKVIIPRSAFRDLPLTWGRPVANLSASYAINEQPVQPTNLRAETCATQLHFSSRLLSICVCVTMVCVCGLPYELLICILFLLLRFQKGLKLRNMISKFPEFSFISGGYWCGCLSYATFNDSFQCIGFCHCCLKQTCIGNKTTS